MSTAPTWGPIASDTADLLDLLAETNPAIPSEAEEWIHFVSVLEWVAAGESGRIDQNAVRPLLHGEIKPNRIGPMYRRAVREGLIRSDGWTETTNSESGNGGKPAKAYRWLGTQGGESNAR